MSRQRAARHVRAAETFGRKIVSGELAPGLVIPNAADLARQMSISRPAMREAIKLLAGKGLLESTPRRGTVVRPPEAWNRLDPDVLFWQMGDAPSAAFVRDLYEVRRIIEPEAAALAASRASADRIAVIERALLSLSNAKPSTALSVRADVAFHLSILAASGNDFLASFGPVIQTSLAIAIKFQRRSCHATDHFVPDHRDIVEAIRRGDPDAAREAVRKQLAQAEIDANEARKASDAFGRAKAASRRSLADDAAVGSGMGRP
jgi:DNA-binding FadR family transcriptional regulator